MNSVVMVMVGLLVTGSHGVFAETISEEPTSAIVGEVLPYEPLERPDPFVDPFEANGVSDQVRPQGLRGQRVGEVKVQGVMLLGAVPVVLVQGSDGVGHLAAQGSALWDGRVEAVDFQAGRVTFRERVEDIESQRRWRAVEVQLVR